MCFINPKTLILSILLLYLACNFSECGYLISNNHYHQPKSGKGVECIATLTTLQIFITKREN